MTVAISGNKVQFLALKNLCTSADRHSFIQTEAAATLAKKVDLIFDFNYNKNINYNSLAEAVFVNEVIDNQVGYNRFNGWNSFYETAPLEIAFANPDDEGKFIDLGLPFTAVPNIAGMLTARVVCMIINEAYFALGENVSTKDEINTAMKLGTSYPYGPFEWCEKIGIDNVYHLLNKLAEDKRYTPSLALVNEFNNK